MTQKDKNLFFEYKKQIFDNLKTLQTNLDGCEEVGMIDENEVTYNEIIDLLDETRGSQTLLELSDVISRARVIETKLDFWFSKEGITNIELSWPQI